ncbi:MAG TPA: hypothetical protein VGK73_08770 [Polyangiaceae bacterium]
MAYITDSALDAAIAYLVTNAEELWIISGASDPADYAAALAAKLGEKLAPTLSAPQNGASNGRRTVVSAITDGEVTATGTATRWVLVKTSGTPALLTCQTLSSSQGVTDNNTFTLGALSVTIPDAA